MNVKPSHSICSSALLCSTPRETDGVDDDDVSFPPSTVTPPIVTTNSNSTYIPPRPTAIGTHPPTLHTRTRTRTRTPDANHNLSTVIITARCALASYTHQSISLSPDLPSGLPSTHSLSTLETKLPQTHIPASRLLHPHLHRGNAAACIACDAHIIWRGRECKRGWKSHPLTRRKVLGCVDVAGCAGGVTRKIAGGRKQRRKQRR
jgi:hypothetical protein